MTTTQESPEDAAFRAAWAEKNRHGYQYGDDALEHVRMGWDMARAALCKNCGESADGTDRRVYPSRPNRNAREIYVLIPAQTVVVGDWLRCDRKTAQITSVRVVDGWVHISEGTEISTFAPDTLVALLMRVENGLIR